MLAATVKYTFAIILRMVVEPPSGLLAITRIHQRIRCQPGGTLNCPNVRHRGSARLGPRHH